MFIQSFSLRMIANNEGNIPASFKASMTHLPLNFFFFFALLIRHFRVHLRDLRMLLLFVVVVFSYICSYGL